IAKVEDATVVALPGDARKVHVPRLLQPTGTNCKQSGAHVLEVKTTLASRLHAFGIERGYRLHAIAASGANATQLDEHLGVTIAANAPADATLSTDDARQHCFCVALDHEATRQVLKWDARDLHAFIGHSQTYVFVVWLQLRMGRAEHTPAIAVGRRQSVPGDFALCVAGLAKRSREQWVGWQQTCRYRTTCR